MVARANSQNTVAFQHHPAAWRRTFGSRVDIVVGHNISSAREEKRASVAWLAKEAKVSQEALAAYEDGSARPVPGDLLAIADCLGVPLSRFFAGL